ncbi:hypothetical protein TSOC_006450 [Tetrabaena socialis]|uniref:Lipid desaturase domain-containing protein n=1 Tax=Tetrabaena socialis TaxID=47790 RepID=A0A2J8A3M7_9CHLO|nr:hypothetical protein TSOC_006450 [Tetrabaena socialis]|eukprot:PNH07122.1 hypothetical protein TSOC_006450 [Tetrabaena socialis]
MQACSGLANALAGTVAATAAALVAAAAANDDTAAAWAPPSRLPYVVAVASVELEAETATTAEAGFADRTEGSTAGDAEDAGVLIGRRMHGAHHRSPFEGNYCIVSGLWNPLLDSTAFFRKMEALIHDSTGVEPRCWHEPEYEWRELERPAEGAGPAV